MKPSTMETYVMRSEIRGRGSRRAWHDLTSLTAGRCRELIAQCEAKGGLDNPSRVNPAFTKRAALDIFIAALAAHADNKPVRVASCKNILRETQTPLGDVGKPWPRAPAEAEVRT